MKRRRRNPIVKQVHRGFSMDFTSQIEFAQRPDGQWFTRWQYRDPRYGYKWEPWRKCLDPRGPDRHLAVTDRTVRLPKG